MKGKSIYHLLLIMTLLVLLVTALTAFVYFQGGPSESSDSVSQRPAAQATGTPLTNGVVPPSPTGGLSITTTQVVTPTRNISLTATVTATSMPSVTATISKTASAITPVPVVSINDYTQNPACFLPDGFGQTNPLGLSDRCPLPFLPPRAVAVKLAPTATPTVAAKATPTKGDSPFNARDMTGEWENIGANQSIWYKVNNENNFYLDVWLDAYGRTGLGFLAFSPEQANGLSATTPPKGRGAPNKADPSHDLMWRGAQATGVWYFLVTNSNNVAVQYKIGNKQATEDRNCRSYWEYLSTGQYVFWTACR